MKSSILKTAGIISLLTLPFFASAADKQGAVGISSYALAIDEDTYGEDEFTGIAFSGDYYFSDNVSARFQYYSLEHDDLSEMEMTGFDAVIWYGQGFKSEGFKWFVGGGFYSETLEFSIIEEDFSGAQLNGGIGFNWEHVSLDLSIGFRSTGDYEDFNDENLGDTGDVTAVTSALTLGYRF
ncbi:hypothetical protein [Thalassotalea crassostreae]|uniref:hypothetical protein n=1 Tax=Thalassotalea crassostreae TaxID=1763536 RepID=UPI000838BA96|nr:hypothetical protein [Thalassotalea crassostreae]